MTQPQSFSVGPSSSVVSTHISIEATSKTLSPPSMNRCRQCGRFVGDTYAAYEHDRTSDRGGLWCENCFTANPYPPSVMNDKEPPL